ncbi:MAG: transglutaminase-like domain-containing protein [Flammeovirgaceae bacterium]
MRSIKKILNTIYSYASHKQVTLSNTIDVHFTLENMDKAAREFAWQVKELAEYLEGESVYETCENIFHFIREHVEWVKEKGEQLRSPAMTLATGLGDCDCTSILTSAILLNLNIEHVFRVVAHMEQYPNRFTHVFVVVNDGDEEVFIDVVPEIDHFNAKKIKFYKQQNYLMSTVLLYGLGSLTDEEKAIKKMLETEYSSLATFAQQAQLTAEQEREMAILKSVIAFVGTERFEEVLINAINNSVVAKDAYEQILMELADDDLNGLGFLKAIRKGLDKLGETGIGKAFRNVRDRVLLPALEKVPGGSAIRKAAGKAGDVFNKVTADRPQERPAQTRTQTSPVPARRETMPTARQERTTPAPSNEDEPDKPNKFKAFVTKHKKWIIIAIVVLVAIAVGTWAYNKNKKKKKNKRSLRGGRKRKGVTNQQILQALEGMSRTPRKRKKRKSPARKTSVAATKRKHKICVTKKKPRYKKAA